MSSIETVRSDIQALETQRDALYGQLSGISEQIQVLTSLLRVLEGVNAQTLNASDVIDKINNI